MDLLFEVLDVEGAEALMANSWIVTRGIRIEGWVMMVVVMMMVVVVMVLTIKTLRKMRVMVPMTIVLTWVGGVVVVVVVVAAAAAAAGVGVVVVVVVVGTGDGLFVRPAMPTVCGVALHSTWGRDPGTPRLLW